MRVVAIFIIGFFFASCGKLYYNRDGETFRMLSQKKDPVLVDSESLQLNSFDLNTFLNQDFNTDPQVQYIQPSDIEDILQSTEELFIILYYPNCKAAADYIKLAKNAEKRGIPFILISITNSPKTMKKSYELGGIENKNCYIIPFTKHYTDEILTKKVQFISEICETCYQQYKDELLYTEFIIMKEKGEVVKLDLADKIRTPEEASRWIAENFSE